MSTPSAPHGDVPDAEQPTPVAGGTAERGASTLEHSETSEHTQSSAERTAAGPGNAHGDSGPGSSGHSHRRGHGAVPALALAALGVVFGDIGTSPLYSLQTVFEIDNHAIAPTRENVLGVISMVFWSITIIVCYAYAYLMMKADNEGEGGILSLVALLRSRLASRPKLVAAAILMGICGASLFFGDSVITPAISVMSSVEGLELVSPRFEDLVLPISVVVLTVLFSFQRFGTGKVGKFFGPIMGLWFVSIAALALPHVIKDPSILYAVLPSHAIQFAVRDPHLAFVAMGAVVLTCTGVEALYADMGHFGPRPIRLSWFCLVFPCLIVAYMGMGAMILDDPATIDNPFFHLAPHWARVPLVILATFATVIASQAVISGAFSVSRQAVRAGLLPRLKINQTSKEEGGQIYIGSINWLLFVCVLMLVGIFQSSAHLANAYGFAVTGTLLLEMTVFLFLAHFVWQVNWLKIAAAVVLIMSVELIFFVANVAKVFHGGWLPLLIAGTMVTIMTTWRAGHALVSRRRVEFEGPLAGFIQQMHDAGLPRIPGLAVFPHPDATTTPLALRQLVDFTHVLHERVAIVSIVNENVPHIHHVDRASVNDLGFADDGVVHITYRVGFNDSQDVPKALEWAAMQDPEVSLEPEEARYFLSSLRVSKRDIPTMSRWRRSLYLWLSGLAASRTDVFHLPLERTIVIGGHLEM